MSDANIFIWKSVTDELAFGHDVMSVSHPVVDDWDVWC